MRFTFLLTALLLCSTTIHSMESIPHEIVSSAFHPHLDRVDKSILKCVNKKWNVIVLSQDELNKQYTAACEKQDTDAIKQLKKMGGFLAHQEFAHAVHNKQYCLATWLIEHKKVDVWHAYCTNMQEAADSAKIEQMLPVITWLLETRKPKTYGIEFINSYQCAQNLAEKYHNMQQLISVFEVYVTKKEDQEEERFYRFFDY